MRSKLSIASFAVLAVTFAATEARAQDPAPSPAPAPAAAAPAAAPASGATSTTPAQEDKPRAVDAEEEELKHVTITANPLSLILTRIGVNVEYLPVKHHAIVVNPYFQHNSISVGAGNSSSETSYTTFGSELGYHFYTGNRGANGFFVGPSVFIQQTSQSTTATAGTASSSADTSMTVYGGILDIGGQHVTKGGFTIGGGMGVMYLIASNKPTATSSTVAFEGVLPRFLFTAGYSF